MILESRPLGWLLVVVWFAWLSALQQGLAGGAVFELAAPDERYPVLRLELD